LWREGRPAKRSYMAQYRQKGRVVQGRAVALRKQESPWHPLEREEEALFQEEKVRRARQPGKPVGAGCFMSKAICSPVMFAVAEC